MSKVFIEETTLTNIGAAIREKTGKSDLIAPGAMPEEIRGISGGGGGGGSEVEPIVLSGNCDYACAGAVASNYIKLFGNTVSTVNITNAQNMFYYSTLESIPFDINITGIACDMTYMFSGCQKLKILPKINYQGKPYSLGKLFVDCVSLREIPDNYFDGWDWSNFTSASSPYIGNAAQIFQYCHSLRKLPLEWLKNMNPQVAYNYSYFNVAFFQCYALDELINLPIPYEKSTWNKGCMSNMVANCHRLKNLIFETNEDGTPKVMKWKSQLFDISAQVGYCSNSDFNSKIVKTNSGITADKEVFDDATYQALKNDPDWSASNINYSRYNHDSAVATINSLPDTSAYLAEKGGTNTIRFEGASGALTDGGAINTLTEEEIAVAAAKGWTVSLV